MFNLIPEPLIILFIALLIDLVIGEPPRSIHLTVWIGRFIGKLEQPLRKHLRNEYVGGILLALSSIALFSILIFFVVKLLAFNQFFYLIISAFVLKMTFALTCMYQHVVPVMSTLDTDLNSSRKQLSLAVRRETATLDHRLVASGAVETVAEGFVDGFFSPLFFYLLFGLPGAVAYRVINTLDSMVGYRDERYIRFGWFSAKLDTLANYLPARLTYLVFIIAAFVLRMDWKGAIHIGWKYHASTSSKNAGWPMSTIAGALRVRLEKLGSYALGENKEPLTPKKIQDALMIFTVGAFILVFLITMVIIIGGSLYEAYVI